MRVKRALAVAVIFALAMSSQAYAYTDVQSNAWYSSYVDKASALGIVSGYGDGTFGPNDPLTLAQWMQMVYNVYGDAVTYLQSPTPWYANTMVWDAKNSVTSLTGYASAVRRDYAVRVLWVMHGKLPSDQSLDTYADADQIDSDCVDAMKWAIATGIMSGTDATHLSPSKTLTRAEAVTILLRDADSGKSVAYPTTGHGTEVNTNGYTTNASVDTLGAHLEYEFLDALNEYLAESGRGQTYWTTCDEIEELALCRAKEAWELYSHSRPEGSKASFYGECLMRTSYTLEGTLTAWQKSEGHNNILLNYCPGAYIACASYRGCWALVVVPASNVQTAIKSASSNYY